MKHKQGNVFFLVTSIGNLDNLVDLEDESPRSFDSVVDAISEAKDIAQNDGLKTYIYKCIPIHKVERGKVRLTNLKELK